MLEKTALPMHADKPVTRVVQDIRMVLAHPPAVAAFIRHYMLEWTSALSCMTDLRKYERQLGIHAQWEDDLWLPPVQLEVCAHLYRAARLSCQNSNILPCSLPF